MRDSIVINAGDPDGPIKLRQSASYYLIQDHPDGRYRESILYPDLLTLIEAEKHRSVEWEPWHGHGVCDDYLAATGEDDSYQCSLPLGHEGHHLDEVADMSW